MVYVPWGQVQQHLGVGRKAAAYWGTGHVDRQPDDWGFQGIISLEAAGRLWFFAHLLLVPCGPSADTQLPNLLLKRLCLSMGLQSQFVSQHKPCK